MAMTLLRYLRSLGLRPVAAGNLKGIVGLLSNPGTAASLCRDHGLECPESNFVCRRYEAVHGGNGPRECDGISGWSPWHYGPACEHVREIADLLPADQMLGTGLVDFALGAAPYTGALSSSTRKHRSRRLSWRITSSGMAHSTSSIHRFICPTSRSHRPSGERSFTVTRQLHPSQGPSAK